MAVVLITALSALCSAGAGGAPASRSTIDESTPEAERDAFMVGGDVSMLPVLERAGAMYRGSDGAAGDAIRLLGGSDMSRHGTGVNKAGGSGMNAFRLRVFVNPLAGGLETQWGAVQDLESMVAMGVRVKQSGGRLLLSLHYSDTWADPEHQHKPAAWAGLHGESLEREVERYTASVVRRFGEAGAGPDYVQVGNEVTAGLLWPDGKLVNKGPEAEQAESWKRLGRLLAAGARGVKAASPSARVVVHVHGGGDPKLPGWFFGKLAAGQVEYDVIGLSFYPAFGNHLAGLKSNLADLSSRFSAEILVVETSYPWRALPDLKERSAMNWPETEEGQLRFWEELYDVCRAEPRCRGIFWWYPEAIVPAGVNRDLVWRGGSEGLFRDDGVLTQAGRRISLKRSK